MTFGSWIVYLLSRIERKLVLFFVMGRKGKRVHEQSVESSAPSHDYETIKVVPTQKQESTVTESTASSGISAPGLDPPVSRAEPTRPPIGPVICPFQQKCQCTFPCCRCDASHVLHRCKQHVNWFSAWLEPTPIGAVGLLSLAVLFGDGISPLFR